MNIDEHVGYTLASDDMFHGPEPASQIGKAPSPPAHATHCLSNAGSEPGMRTETGFENQPFLFIPPLPDVSAAPPDFRRDPRPGKCKDSIGRRSKDSERHGFLA